MWRSAIVRIRSQRQGGQEWRGKKKRKRVWNGGNRRSETGQSQRSETGWNGGQRQYGVEVRDRVEWGSETGWKRGQRQGGMEVRDRVEWRSDRVEWRSETGWNGGQRQAEARSKMFS